MEELDTFISEKRQKKDDLPAYKYLGSWGGRSRGREGTVIRAGKSQEWDWGVRTSIRKRKIQMNSSAGFLTVMSAGHWRSLLREIPAPQ